MEGSRPFVHPQALVETRSVGAATRIWAFVHVLEGAVIGRNCNIGDHCFIEGDVVIGDDVVVKNGVSIWAGVRIENGAFIGPNVVFTNVLWPRAKIFPDRWQETLVKQGASIGANATIICGTQIGRFAMVGAGSLVSRPVPDFGLVVGNPARLAGWVCKCGKKLLFQEESGQSRLSEAQCSCGLAFRKSNDSVLESL